MRPHFLYLLRLQSKQKTSSFNSDKCRNLKLPHTRAVSSQVKNLELLSQTYPTDHFTNLTPAIIEKLGANLHNKQHHPLGLIRQRIQDFFYRNFVGRNGNPIFAVFDNLSPVVTLGQNFDNLLVPIDHPSRQPKDSYYLNSEYMLRAHTTCHSCDIVRAGLDTFLTVGDVYRRDTIDKTHYPVFHQMDGVRLFTDAEVVYFHHMHSSGSATVISTGSCNIFSYIKYRWVECSFPFTHPSWELEIFYEGDWLEVLGCGILEQQILTNCGIKHKAGWAFGLGLERLAMRLYGIPDVRLFWSNDSGFLSQFKVADCHTPITFKEVSRYPSLAQDISFWIEDISNYSSNDFYDLTRSVGGELIEQVDLIDDFTHPKTGRTSHTYRVTYRHMHRNLTTQEINVIQETLRDKVAADLHCTVRC